MGTHPRPVGAADALSVRLRAETAEVHREAEQRPFMKAFFAGRLPREAYVEWLARQWHIYAALEDALVAQSDHPAVREVVPAALHRKDRIARDLDDLTSRSWRGGDHRSPATRRYCERIAVVAEEFPPGLLAHAWLRYLGNVGGQDVLRRLVSAIVEDDTRGLAFTDYRELGDVRSFFRTFHAALDGAPLSPDDTDQVVGEAATAFRLNIALTDELAADLSISAAPVAPHA